MDTRSIIFICWGVAFLIGCIVVYARYRIEKKRSDEYVVVWLKRLDKQIAYSEANINCKIEL